MNEEMKKLLEDFNKVATDLRAEIDNRFKAINEKGYAPADLTQKVVALAESYSKIEAKVDEAKKQAEVIERAIALANAPGGGNTGKAKPVYASLGEQLIDVARASNPDTSASTRTEAIGRLAKVKAAAAGASEGIPADGGFLVQQDFGGLLSTNSVATGVLSAMCFHIPISANANGFKANMLDETSRANGSRYGGIQVYHAAEAATVTATQPKFKPVAMELHKLFGLMYATDELLQDATALTALVNRWFPMEFGYKLDDVILNGSGAGQGLGVLNSGALVQVAKRSGQKADSVIFENIIDMDAQLADASDNTAFWIANRETKPELATMSLAVGTGGIPVYLPANGAAGRPSQELYGRKMLTMEQASALGDVGDLMLFDPNEYIMIDKGGIQSAVSIHVQFLTDQQTFRWTYRYNGQPLRSAPLSPAKGTKVRSPFVAIAAR